MECRYCGATRSHKSNGHKPFTKKSLKDHVRNAHPEKAPKQWRPPGSATCPICGRDKSKTGGSRSAFSWSAMWCHVRDAHCIRLPFPNTIHPGVFVTIPRVARRHFDELGWDECSIDGAPGTQMGDAVGNVVSIVSDGVFRVESGTMDAGDIPEHAYIKAGGEFIHNREVNVFYPKDQVVYIPLHCDGNIKHEDAELGFVTSVHEDIVFCRYFYNSGELRATTRSEGCPPDSLVLYKHSPQVEIDELYRGMMSVVRILPR